MKKIFIISVILLMTGCLGEAGKGYITKQCTKEESINGMIVTTDVTIKSKQGIVKTITIVENYDKNLNIESITNSKKSEQNMYNKNKGITLDINDNIFTYTINTNETTDLIKEKFNLKEEQHKQIKYYEENGYLCK